VLDPTNNETAFYNTDSSCFEEDPPLWSEQQQSHTKLSITSFYNSVSTATFPEKKIDIIMLLILLIS